MLINLFTKNLNEYVNCNPNYSYKFLFLQNIALKDWLDILDLLTKIDYSYDYNHKNKHKFHLFTSLSIDIDKFYNKTYNMKEIQILSIREMSIMESINIYVQYVENCLILKFNQHKIRLFNKILEYINVQSNEFKREIKIIIHFNSLINQCKENIKYFEENIQQLEKNFQLINNKNIENHGIFYINIENINPINIYKKYNPSYRKVFTTWMYYKQLFTYSKLNISYSLPIEKNYKPTIDVSLKTNLNMKKKSENKRLYYYEQQYLLKTFTKEYKCLLNNLKELKDIDQMIKKQIEEKFIYLSKILKINNQISKDVSRDIEEIVDYIEEFINNIMKFFKELIQLLRKISILYFINKEVESIPIDIDEVFNKVESLI